MPDLAELRRRFKNACRRVVYWSGRPSFSGFGFRPGKHFDPDGQYEMAMIDADYLAGEIEVATGVRPKVRDIKAEVADAFFTMLKNRKV